MAAYLEASIIKSGNDDAFVAQAIGDIARAMGITFHNDITGDS